MTHSTTDVARATGVPYRRIDYWLRRGLLSIDDDTPGSGIPRRWTDADVAEVALIGRLLDLTYPTGARGPGAGWSMDDHVRPFLDEWRRVDHRPGLLIRMGGHVQHHPPPGNRADRTDLLDLRRLLATGAALVVIPVQDPTAGR